MTYKLAFLLWKFPGQFQLQYLGLLEDILCKPNVGCFVIESIKNCLGLSFLVKSLSDKHCIYKFSRCISTMYLYVYIYIYVCVCIMYIHPIGLLFPNLK